MSEQRYNLRGEIDLSTVPEVRAGLRKAVRATTPGSQLLIDCAALTFIDSSGVAVLLEANRDLEATGRHLVIVNVPSTPRRSLEILGLADLIRSDRQDASA